MAQRYESTYFHSRCIGVDSEDVLEQECMPYAASMVRDYLCRLILPYLYDSIMLTAFLDRDQYEPTCYMDITEKLLSYNTNSTVCASWMTGK